MSNPPRHPKPEVMSPAGYWPQLHAAIEAGADAVYFGLTHFSARAKVGFTLEELPDALRTLHARGVKGYVTFNTLTWDEELGAAAQALAAIAAAGADAIIVQDIGVAQLARAVAPGLEVHGSTQMSITSAEGVALARRFGVSRVVLARELSVAEIAAIRAASDTELEVFCHGALCVSYSGQCFSSEAWGGRSANRGQCAQACRLPYELIVDGQHRPLADARYLLSPEDLNALSVLPQLVQAGVSALKIEGRYKDAEFVALTTRAYRRAVDEAYAGLPLSLTAAEQLHVEQVYSRGQGPHFLSGTNHQTVVKARFPRHRGVLVGQVLELLPDGVLVAPQHAAAIAPIKPGDGLVFDAAAWRSPEEREEGGRVYQVAQQRGGATELRFARGALDLGRIRAGDLVWRSHDPQLDKLALPYTQASAPLRRQPLNISVTAHAGAPLSATFALAERPNVRVTVRSPEPLGTAARRALDEATLREQLGRLGGTAYELAELTADLHGDPFIPASALNALRREAVERLAQIQERPRPMGLRDPQTALDQLQTSLASQASTVSMPPSEPQASGALASASERPPSEHSERSPQASAASAAPARAPASGARLHLLVRTPEQLEAALAERPASITLDYLELYGLRPAVERVQAAGIVARVASPRVLKPSEQRVVHFLRKLGCGILVRSGGLLEALHTDAEQELTGDFSLNIANELSARTLLRHGLTRFAPTHDLNAAQIAALASALGPGVIEVIGYHHLPVFHTEHCVFCRFLSSGTSYKDCGHPCEQHRVALRDQHGRAHPVMADVGCRNTVFGAEAQEASRHLERWLAAGVRDVRLEFVHEDAAQVALVSQAFSAALRGQIGGAELSRRLRQAAPQGTTEGSLFVPGGAEVIPLLT